MFRNVSRWVVAVVLLSLPSAVLAGGPPLICLPVDGVTSENAEKCSEVLSSKLASLVWKHSSQPHGVTVVRHADQWYLTFYMGQDVHLAEVKAAMDGTAFSVPLDRLRLFGHAILEIDARSASHKALQADLDAVPYVSIEKSKVQKDLLVVTLDMPYPVETKRRDRDAVGWETFRRNDFSADQVSLGVETPATPETLASYRALRNVVTKHDAVLKDISWSPNYACRTLGAVAGPTLKEKSQQVGSASQ